MTDELYLHSHANEPNKSPWRERIKALLLWEIGHLSSPSRSCLGSLILHQWWTGGLGGCVKAPQQVAMVHLHNGILHSREKEGAYTLCNGMDGTGEHYANWNKPDSERQMPYDLTFNRNLMNKMNKQAKYNQRHWNWEQADCDQRGERRGITEERRERVRSRNMYKGPMDKDNSGEDWM